MGWFDWLRRSGAEDRWAATWKNGLGGGGRGARSRRPGGGAARPPGRRRPGRRAVRDRARDARRARGGRRAGRHARRRAAPPRSPPATAPSAPTAAISAPRSSLPDDPAQPSGTLLLTERPRDLHRRIPGADDPVARGRPRVAAEPRSRADPQRSAGPAPLPLQHLRGRDAGRVSWRGTCRSGAYNPSHVTDRARHPHRPGRHRTPARRRPFAARRCAHRPGLEPGVDRRRFRHAAEVARRRSRDRPGRAVRSAARLPIRPAGQHDRDAARPRRAAADPDLLALQRDPRADAGDAPRRRRAGDRSAGRRHARLHLRLHDGELHARRGPARRPRRRLRPPEPGRRRRGRRGRCSGRTVRRSSGSSRSRCGTA